MAGLEETLAPVPDAQDGDCVASDPVPDDVRSSYQYPRATSWCLPAHQRVISQALDRSFEHLDLLLGYDQAILSDEVPDFVQVV